MADEYIHHYYGDEYFAAARTDTLTAAEQLRAELAALAAAGTTDLVLYPASGELEQITLLAEALTEAGFPPARNVAERHISEIDVSR
jgi:hypothetical protein